jgi:hypothetical protein
MFFCKIWCGFNELNLRVQKKRITLKNTVKTFIYFLYIKFSFSVWKLLSTCNSRMSINALTPSTPQFFIIWSTVTKHFFFEEEDLQHQLFIWVLNLLSPNLNLTLSIVFPNLTTRKQFWSMNWFLGDDLFDF